jgi:hypothetical protein
MKRLFTILILTATFFGAESFKMQQRMVHADQFKNDGYVMAVIDGKVFEVRENNKYTAELKNKSAGNPLFGEPGAAKISRVATVVNVFGGDFQDADGNTFNESIGFEYTFNNGALGEGADKSITLNYSNDKYYSIAGESKIKISRIDWSADRRSFVLDADFDCKLRKWGMPAASQPVVAMKGKIENITVSVPSWIVLNSAMPVAADKE